MYAATLAIIRELRLSQLDLLILRSGDTLAAADVTARIVEEQGPWLARALAALAAGLAVLWTISAGIGRTLTLRHMFPSAPVELSPLGSLTALRAIAALAALAACFGAALAAGWMAAGDLEPRPFLFLLIYLPLLVLLLLVWSALNWFLSLAPLFAAREGRSAAGALASTARWLRRERSAVQAITRRFALARLTAITLATALSIPPLLLLSAAPTLAAVLLGIIALSYFATADLLYLARLAAYAEAHAAAATSTSR